MDAGAPGSGSQGLVKGKYVRGGACVAARGAAHLRREVAWTSGSAREDVRAPGVTRGLVRSREGVLTRQAVLAHGRR